MAVAFDDAAMGADDLGDQRQAKPRSVRLGGDEGIEEIGEEIGRNAGTIVDHAEFQRQRYLLASASNREPDTRAIGRRQHRSEEHTSELQSLMRISYAVFCLKK